MNCPPNPACPLCCSHASHPHRRWRLQNGDQGHPLRRHPPWTLRAAQATTGVGGSPKGRTGATRCISEGSLSSPAGTNMEDVRT